MFWGTGTQVAGLLATLMVQNTSFFLAYVISRISIQKRLGMQQELSGLAKKLVLSCSALAERR